MAGANPINRLSAGRRCLNQYLTCIVLAAGLMPWSAHAATVPPPPATHTDNVREVIHGVEIVDSYRWLEDQTSPQTRDWIRAQNEYAQSIVDSVPGREALRQELVSLMRTDMIGLPVVRAGRYFFAKRPADKDLDIIYARQGANDPDEVLIDPHPMSEDHTVSVGILDVSRDGRLLAYEIREGGEDESALRVLDVERRVDLADSLPKRRYYEVRFLPDGSAFYYSWHGEDGPRVCHHVMGQNRGKDIELFGHDYGPDKSISIDLAGEGRYLILTVWHGSASRSDVYCRDLKDNLMVPIVNDIDAEFEAKAGGDHLFIQTNWEAPHGRIFAVDLADPDRSKWQEIVPETHAVIRNFSAAAGKVFVTYLDRVVNSVTVFDPDGGLDSRIDLPTIGRVSSIKGEWQHEEVFYSFSSFHIPATIYRYEVASGNTNVWERIEIPIESDSFEVRQVWFYSKDGTRVPMFIGHAKGIALDGTNPALLTGYGGFRASLSPRFSSSAALWMKHGGVYAVPNLRGGGEFGEDWHRAGMLDKKQNTFDDFIAAADWLITNGYTSPERLAISGSSNGGLLVGAALTQRPDLFRAVVCTYPLLDMVRYHKFLVAKFWVPEYGSADDPDQFPYLYAYSPYHHVKKGVEYPAVLFVTGDADTRVDPLHARKMTAHLQAANASENPILLLYDTKAGHSGGKPLTKRIDDTTDEFLFLFSQMGVDF